MNIPSFHIIKLMYLYIWNTQYIKQAKKNRHIILTANLSLHMWISVTEEHWFINLTGFSLVSFQKDHLPWNEMRPRAAFFPRLFSTTHSYVPVSSCWKLGISSTALEFFILTLLGKGTPLVLLQLISGTGLWHEERNSPMVMTVWDEKNMIDCTYGHHQCLGKTFTKAVSSQSGYHPFSSERRLFSNLNSSVSLWNILLLAMPCFLRMLSVPCDWLSLNMNSLSWIVLPEFQNTRCDILPNHKIIPNIDIDTCTLTYFPRAKHSSFTTDPFAAGTVSAKCTSILGSYSPIAPMKGIQYTTLLHQWLMGCVLCTQHERPNNNREAERQKSLCRWTLCWKNV